MNPSCRNKLCVVKLGGSLLDWSELRTAWCRWLKSQPKGTRHLLLAGGGAWVETIRTRQSVCGWSDAQSHWMAIDCMAITARVLAYRLQLPWRAWPPPRCLKHGSLRSLEAPATVIDVARWLREDEPQPDAEVPLLPVGWETTSDAIAARVAAAQGGCELILLKSCDPPPGDVDSWIERGFVDPSLRLYTNSCGCVTAVNLRRFACAP